MSATSSSSSSSSSERLPWVEKYRPSTLSDVVAHDEILATLRRLMDSGNLPHLLFYGPPGTGKTTTIKACSHYLYGSDRVRANVLEMNASDDRGIDVVRQQVREFASTSSIFALLSTPSKTATVDTSAAASDNDNDNNNTTTTTTRTPPSYKLVVLDEADQMSHDAQAALRRIIEKYTSNVRFCILCNHINKVIPALQSRCTRFRFAPVKRAAMLPRLTHVATAEGVPFTADGLAAAYRLSHGDLRRCLNTMQATALSAGTITEASVYRTTGNPTPAEVTALVSSMLDGDFAACWQAVSRAVADTGVSMADLTREIHPIVVAMDLPQDCKCYLLTQLATLEYYAAGGASEKIGLAGMLGAFQLVKEAVTRRQPIASLVAAGGSATGASDDAMLL